MAVTNIEYVYNTPGIGVDHLTVHNDVNIFINVTYSGASAPDVINMKIYGKNSGGYYLDLLADTYPLVYDDVLNVRTFVLNGGEILKTFMDSFNDTLSPERVLDYLPNMTKEIKFVIESESISIDVYALLRNAVTQIHDEIIMTEDFDQQICFTSGDDEPVYLYFFNDNDANEIVIEDPDKPAIEDTVAFTHDDLIYWAHDGYYYRINVEK